VSINYSVIVACTCMMLFSVSSHATSEAKPIEGELPKEITLYGTYTDGCLLKGHQLDIDKYISFKAAFESPNRFGHDTLIRILADLDEKYRDQFPDFLKTPVLVGELSRNGGGVTIPHFSHQLGLDIDFYFFSSKANAQWPFSYVQTGRGVTKDFDLERNWWLAGYFSLSPQVDRIFVAPEVKITFCHMKGKLRHWKGKEDMVLAKLRAWYGHRDHFHVRLKCPNNEPHCFNRASALGKSNGCERAKKWLKKKRHHKAKPRLDYSKKGKFNIRCWPKQRNIVAYPGAKALFHEDSD